MILFFAVYEKESAWREVHEKIKNSSIELKSLRLKTLKELIKFWQSKAFHDSVRQGGPVTPVEKLIYFIYNIDKNAAAPFANMPNGQLPPLIKSIPNCTHFSSAFKLEILNKMLQHKRDLRKEETWEKILKVANGFNITNANKLKFAIKNWNR